jgi:polynucleotide 5'-kinase involved in rRNA processing
MRTCRRPGDLERAGPEHMVFVGTANPARRIPAVVDAARRMVEEARAAGAGTVLVDTTGLVRGGLGKALKLAKVRAIGPDAVVALERERGELEHIISSLEGLEGVRVFRLRASRHARKRTATERKRNREARLKRYLAPSRTLRLKAGRLEVLSGGGEGVDLFSAEPGTVVGLNRGRETLALGVYAGRSGGRALIRTPLKDARGLRKVIVGELKVDYA